MLRYLILSITACTLYATAIAQAQLPVMKSQLYFRYYAGNNTAIDSTIFIHSTGRNSTAHIRNIDYLHTDGYRYDTAITYFRHDDNPYYIQKRIIQTFDALDSVTIWETQQYDTYSHKYMPLARRRYTYNANHLPDSVITYNYNGVTLTPVSHTIYTYDGNGKPLRIRENRALQPSQVWAPYKDESYTYDGFGKKLSHKIKTWNLSTGIPDSTLNTYTYNTNNHLLIDSFFHNNAYFRRTEYIHTGNGLLFADFTLDIYDEGYRRIYKYDANNNMVRIDIETWDAQIQDFDKTTRIHYYYNSHNQLTRHGYDIRYNDDWLPSADADVIDYYYPLAINDITKPGNPVRLYPVPATHTLNLELETGKAQPVSVTILDIQGRVMKHFTDNAAGSYKKAIDINGLPAGQYLLQAQTAGMATVQQFSIVR